MSLRKRKTRDFFRKLYAAELETVKLYKRGDDQLQGQIVTHIIFGVRFQTRIVKQGQTIEGSMSSDNRRMLHIPIKELERVGVRYINALDTFEDKEGRTWRPESTVPIISQLFENVVKISVLRVT
jgi:hypothetical protein